MVSEGCILNGVNARRSIIGLRSRIGNGTKVENSILMGSDFFENVEEMKMNVSRVIPHIGIGENCIIKRSIIDKNARIGKNVQLINSRGIDREDGTEGNYFIREGIILIPKNAIIPDGTVI